MRLGALVGELDWEKAIDGLSLEQFLMWQALDDIEGIGWKRDDMREAHHLSWLLAAQGCKDIKLSDLRLDLDALPEA